MFAPGEEIHDYLRARRRRGGHRAARALRRRDVERPLVGAREPLGGDDDRGHLVGPGARRRRGPPRRAAHPRRRGPRGLRRPGDAHRPLGRRRGARRAPASGSSGPGRRRRRSSRAWPGGPRSSWSSSAPRPGWCRAGTGPTPGASAVASSSIPRPPARCAKRSSTTPSGPSTPDGGCARRSTSCATAPGATCTTRSTTRTCGRASPPGYEIGCKRIVLSDELYPALARDDVTLEDSALARVEGRTAVAASGARHRARRARPGHRVPRRPPALRDAGARAARVARRALGGRDDRVRLDHRARLPQHVRARRPQREPRAQLRDLHDRDPDRVRARGAGPPRPRRGPLEVSAAAEQDYVRDVDAAAQDTVWLRGGCRSWYLDEVSGRLTLLWPGSARSFRERNARFDPAPYRS